MVKQPSKLAIFGVLFMAVVVTALVLWSSFRAKNTIPPKLSEASVTKEELKKETQIDFLAPSGKAVLTMATKAQGEEVVQTFYIDLLNGEEKLEIFSQNSTTDDFLIVPYNTFSPDDKFIFLKQKSPDFTEYIVLRTNGEDMREGKKYVKVIEPFKEKYPDLFVTEVTGWGGVNLLVINANDLEGNPTASYWFDLSNLSFIRLSNRFN